jgi:putative phosphoesterase
MKIAIIADIHANWPALKAVWKDIQKQKVDCILHLGDFIGYSPFPNEVVDKIRRENIFSIVGNYDLKVLEFHKKKKSWKKKHPAKFFSFEWTDKILSSVNRKYLASLKSKKAIQLEGLKFLLVHGSPEGIDDPLDLDTPQSRLEWLAGNVKEDVVLCGHTHIFFVRKARGVTFINPGSIGRPFDGNWKTSYAVLEIKGKRLKVLNRRLVYEIAQVERKMKKEKFPEEIFQSIIKGRSIDDLGG